MKKILLVDDEPNLLAALQRALRKQFLIETACGGAAGLAALQNPQEFAVVVADMQMPEMNGVEFLAKVKERAPDVVRMMLTGNADQKTAIEAINEGSIFRFLNKPCPPEKLAEALTAGLRQHHLITVERDVLENTLRGCVKVLTEILAMADPKAFGNAEKVRKNIHQMAEKLQLKDVWELEVAAMLSYMGLVSVPPETLLKARHGLPLTNREHEMFRRIPAVGGELLGQIPRLEIVSKILTYQNKGFDGEGFPDDEVAGEAIPLGARMLKIFCDLADLEGRGIGRTAALEQMWTREGWYDPRLLELAGPREKAAPQEKSFDTKSFARIPFADLRTGHVLRTDVETRDGTLIIVAGNRITPALLTRLRNFSTISGIKEPINVEF